MQAGRDGKAGDGGCECLVSLMRGLRQATNPINLAKLLKGNNKCKLM